VTIASNSTAPTEAATAAWAALAPQITVTGVTISSPPVVDFKVLDANGMPVIGLGNKSQSGTATVAGLTNIGFTLAKLVPGSNGAPSKWVSYLVTRPPTKAEVTLPAGQTDYTKLIASTASCNATPTTAATWCGIYPSTDTQGALQDHGDGTYTYTFYRDPQQAASIVAGLTDSADGLSKKADLGDLKYDATLTHRLGIQIGGNAPGTGSNTPTATTVTPGVAMGNPANAVYDFRPDGGTVTTSRNVVSGDSCNECHGGKVLNHGSRKDPNYCATCHTDQVKYSFNGGDAPMLADGITFAVQTGTNAQVRPKQAILNGRAVGDLPNMIHKIHMGEYLVKQGYNYNNDDLGMFNEVAFPQDVRNCTKCHDGSDTAAHKTAQGNNWKMVPSRLACGACHDGIDFATNQGVTLAAAAEAKAAGTTPVIVSNVHLGGAWTDDSACTLCHGTGKAFDIDVVHLPVTPPNTGSALHVAGGNQNSNAAFIASGVSLNRLPAGAIKVKYDIKSVGTVVDTSVTPNVKRPTMTFRLMQDVGDGKGFQRADLNVHDATAPDPVTGKREIWPNFMGAPSLYFVWSVPQDGIAAPADFNASISSYLRCLWNGTAQVPADPPECISPGTLTGPDADGYYTATLTNGIVPDGAAMLTGGMGYSYNARSTLPLTQTNVPGYLTSASPVPVGATDATATSTQLLPSMPNRIGGLIVITPNVQKVATGYTGRRAIVEDARCNKCHLELGAFTEDAFHAGQRNDGTTCSWCHNPNRTSSGWSADSTNFVHAIHAGEKRVVPFTWHAALVGESFDDVKFPGVLSKCETCHLPGTYAFAGVSDTVMASRLYRTVTTGTLSSTASALTKYGYAPSTSGAWGAPYVTQDVAYGSGFSFNATTGVSTAAATTTLVNSPITTACFSCHDSAQARAHMEDNGGSIYDPRSTALAKQETCMVCHASGRVADIAAMHAK
jgi:OmcA/MtrC family decaheme c-type cytochrome